MDLDYALITSSSLPEQVRESDYYQTLSKAQFLDLVDYSEVLVHDDPNQKVLLLMVAKGTPEQQEEDRRRRDEESAQKKAERKAREDAMSAAEAAKAREAEAEADRIKAEAEEQGRRKALRERSKSIINGLYNR